VEAYSPHVRLWREGVFQRGSRQADFPGRSAGKTIFGRWWDTSQDAAVNNSPQVDGDEAELKRKE
jgi:hypothetical protein